MRTFITQAAQVALAAAGAVALVSRVDQPTLTLALCAIAGAAFFPALGLLAGIARHLRNGAR